MAEALEALGLPTASYSPTGTRSRIGLLTLLTGISAACALLRFRLAFLRAALPFQLNYEEGNILNAGFRLISRHTPYPKPGSFPYVFNPYGPAGYALTALSMKVFGISLLGPRILVGASAVGVAACIFALAKHYQVNSQIASSFAILFLCLPFVWLWIPVLRVDFWAVIFSLSGILTFATRPNRWAIAATFFALAVLTKPTAAAALAACLIQLLLQKRFAAAAKIALLFGMLISLGMFSLGGYPLFHLLQTHPDEFSLVRAFALYFFVLAQAIPVVIIIGLALRFRFRWRRRSQLLWIYLGMCCLTAFSAGKLGSDTNHFLELQAALCIFAAVASQYLFDSKNRMAIPILSLAVITLLALTLQARVLPLTRPARFGPEAIQVEQCSTVYSFIQRFPGDHVLSNDVSALVVAGKPVQVSNPFVTTQLGDSISWSNGRLDYLAAHRYFDLIVLGQSDITGRWSPEFMEALMKNYKPIREFQCSTAARAFVPQ